MENYKKGMLIRINDKLDRSDPFRVSDDMMQFRGKVATIVFMGRNANGSYVRLNIDRQEHFWSYGMIKPLALNKGRKEG